MAAFHPVNTSLAPPEPFSKSGEETTPTTPRPNTAPNISPQPSRMDDATTPTRATFALASQRPLPSQPSEPSQPFHATMNLPGKVEETAPSSRAGSQYSSKSRDSTDHDMDCSDEDDGSDEESINADGTRSRKKKSQRFYCLDYPPCNLSFTRSEHLARHIRKHTGERPFQCHCTRRFSRLDNLRQHAQTVHVNEEIPQDSLAATGTRFQRQVRTDRVRAPGSRSRASTAGNQSGPMRGHTRNSLSASSISSVGSAFSARDDARRRQPPPPLQMAGNRASQEIYRAESPTHFGYRAGSPGGFSTPTSATFSTAQSSPRWGSGMHSPISSHSRTASIYNGHRTPGRRLSVPSTGNPFQSPQGQAYAPPHLSSENGWSPQSNILASPVSSTHSGWSGRRDSGASATDEAWRRRTWHPETYSNFTSRLQNVTTNYYPNGPPHVPVVPSNAPPLNQNSLRLPGIESFDPLPQPTTPVRRQPSPMMIDTPSRVAPPPEYREERRGSQQWDGGIKRLNITAQDQASSWANDTNHAVQGRTVQAEVQPRVPAVRFEESPYSARTYGNQHFSAPPVTPRESKRQGWYNGPIATRTSPTNSSGSEANVPGTPSNQAEVNPEIVHADGYVESRPMIGNSNTNAYAGNVSGGGYIANPPVVPSNAPDRFPAYGYSQTQGQIAGRTQPDTRPHAEDTSRLKALVDIATGEGNAAAVY